MADSIVEAAKDGLTREVQWFLAQGEDVNVTDSDGRTALHWALQKGHGDCVVTLLRAGADLDLKDNDGNPPLHIAVRHNHLQLVKLLVKAGADLRVVDARSLNSYNLARGILGTQSEVTKFLAEIMEKIAPGSTDASQKSSAAETPQPKHAGLGTDAMVATTSAVTRTNSASAPQRPPAPSGRPAATAAARAQTSEVAAFHSHFLVITYAGISLAVVELSEDLSESLASVRAKMEEDEVPLRFAYSFVFQTTGALITRKQEARFLVAQCASLWAPPTPPSTSSGLGHAGSGGPAGRTAFSGAAPSAVVVGGKETLVYQIEIAKQEKPTRGQFLSAADLDL